MTLDNIQKEMWSSMRTPLNSIDGYDGIFLTAQEDRSIDLLIFIDEQGKKHFVVEVKQLDPQNIKDPNINGLKLSQKQFRFKGRGIKTFVDLECTLNDYSDEFTELIREIATKILLHNCDPLECINNVIDNWRSFWSQRLKEILSEEEQAGLICELIILSRLCEINAPYALESWKGPFRERFDFIFSDWVFEVKATRNRNHVHIINGITQLEMPENKRLALISFIITQVKSDTSFSVQSTIEAIIDGPLKNKPALIQYFNKLLVSAGYSRIHAEQYRLLQFDVIDSKLFVVDNSFPKIIAEDFKGPLNSRITEIRYQINLQGLDGKSFRSLKLSDYFY